MICSNEPEPRSINMVGEDSEELPAPPGTPVEHDTFMTLSVVRILCMQHDVVLPPPGDCRWKVLELPFMLMTADAPADVPF